MAGSNQANNLGGLLQSLTGAFNQEDMGQGMMFAQNIRDYNAPVLDANDPNSLMDRQRWAQMNGYQKEAVAMGSALGKLNAANQLKEENAEKATRMANMFGNMIPNMPEERQDEARSVRDALANGEMSYKEALDWLEGPAGGSGSAPASVREFEFFQSLSKPDQARFLGLQRSGNLIDLGGGGLGYRGPDGTIEVLVTSEEATGNNVKAEEAINDVERAGIDQDKVSEYLGSVQSQQALYQEALRLVEKEQAGTGAIESKLPTIRAASKELEVIGNELGLNVVAGGKFGQLTEKELELALQTGLPPLDGPDLADWLRRKMAANAKLMAEYRNYLSWASDPNNTGPKTAEYYTYHVVGGEKPSDDPQSAEVDVPENGTTDVSDDGWGTTSSGVKYRKKGS
jgi:hypothetical protein